MLLRTISIGLSLMLCAACSTAPAPVQIRTVADLPEPSLTAPVDISQRQLATTGDAFEELGSCRARLKSCAASIDGLREWRAGAVRRNDAANEPKGDE